MSNILDVKRNVCKSCHRCIAKCPVKAIRFKGHQASIINDACILCAQCFVACPREAMEIADSSAEVLALLKGEAPVIASLAPSFFACWNRSGINSVRKALKKLGFYDVEETARAATVIKREYEREIEEQTQDIIISSACPSVNLLVKKHFPELCKFLSPAISPMLAHAEDIKRRMPEAKVVFIGPCASKKYEAIGTAVDAVLTLQELDHMRIAAGIEIEPEFGESLMARTRSFALSGGIIECMDSPDNGYIRLAVSGTDKCMAALNDIRNGKIDRCFIEMSACSGGCIGGPVIEKYINSPVRHMLAVKRSTGTEDFDIAQPPVDSICTRHIAAPVSKPMPTEAELRDILSKLGKQRPEDELNCGSCGYASCREKAIAIYRGLADYGMCTPYIIERSERLSNKVLNNMPTGLVAVNESLEVQQINRAAMDYLNIDHESDVIGESVVRILDTAPFFTALESGKTVKRHRSYFSEYNKYFEQTIVYDRSSMLLLDLISDVTDEEEERLQKHNISLKAAEVADNVIEHQMRIVQEIASLLGETAAETKIALTKLKESLSLDDEEQ